ncbi:transcription factor TFIIIB subunit brf1 [Elasticomyces elasticus]|nr:transcription factor TFIIIB subunit brf1 [Elasticomyces elasticus]
MAAATAPRAPPQRLASLKNTPEEPRTLTKPRARKVCACDEPAIVEHDGARICSGCGQLISENNIVSEVTFGETSQGAAVVQGGVVGENQRYANTLTGLRGRNMGEGLSSHAATEAAGLATIQRYVNRMRAPPELGTAAHRIYKLALLSDFTRGRNPDTAAAVCLQRPENTMLLMDLSEVLEINIFRLGRMYKDLRNILHMGDEHSKAEDRSIRPIDIEPMILKYARKLDFGDKTRRVAEDASKILKRMNRDWMVTGRRPNGLCGACLILAARMNNFRRTVREMVYVVKVADATIAKRLDEFSRTRAAHLSVEEFRKIGNRIKHQHDPPAIRDAALNAAKFKKRQEKTLKRKRPQDEEGSDSVDLESEPESASQDLTPKPATAPQKSAPPAADKGKRSRGRPRKNDAAAQPRRDADGFAIPALPSSAGPEDNATESERIGVQPVRKKRKTRPAPQIPPPIMDADLLEDEGLEMEIETMLENPEVQQSFDEVERANIEARAKATADRQKALCAATTALRRRHAGLGFVVPDDEEIGEEEFDDDPEVANILLSTAQSAIKERIWVAHNADWMRQQQAKRLKEELALAAGEQDDKGKGKGKKKKSRMGDGTVITEAATPIDTPEAAARAMLEKRAKGTFSKRINYSVYNKIYGRVPKKSDTASQASEAESEATDDSASRAASETPSTTSSQHTAQSPRTRTPASEIKIGRQRRMGQMYSPPLARGPSSGALPSPPATQAVKEAAAASPQAVPTNGKEPGQDPSARKEAESESDGEEDDDEEEGQEEEEDEDEGSKNSHDDDAGYLYHRKTTRPRSALAEFGIEEEEADEQAWGEFEGGDDYDDGGEDYGDDY